MCVTKHTYTPSPFVVPILPPWEAAERWHGSDQPLLVLPASMDRVLRRHHCPQQHHPLVSLQPWLMVVNGHREGLGPGVGRVQKKC